MTPAAAPIAALALCLGGCYVTERYHVSQSHLTQAAALSPAERAVTAVPAQREKDGRPVYVRADALPAPADPDVPAEAFLRITTRRYSPMVTAGAVLTVIGSVVSVAGSIGFFTADGSLGTTFGLLALSAEPPMIIGSVLWVLGLHRRPQEVRPDLPTLRYLPAEPVPPLLGLRF